MIRLSINRQAVSEVFSQILIVSLVVVLVATISVFLIPFIKGSFSDAQTCLDVQHSVSFVENRFSCYDSTIGTAGIVLKLESDAAKEFRIAFYDSSGGSTLFDIENGPNPSGFGMFGNGATLAAGDFTLSLPEEGQQLIYLAQGADFSKVDISPVVKGTICPIDDSTTLSSCLPSVNLNFVAGQDIAIFAQVS
ncbi:MAG: hypothetical protein ACP5NS_03805 [Candidatus Pacearchaeota archaeon]